MPVLLKDNIGTKELPTSAGTVALKDWVIGKDATIVENLKENGALILGKLICPSGRLEWTKIFQMAIQVKRTK